MQYKDLTKKYHSCYQHYRYIVMCTLTTTLVLHSKYLPLQMQYQVVLEVVLVFTSSTQLVVRCPYINQGALSLLAFTSTR